MMPGKETTNGDPFKSFFSPSVRSVLFSQFPVCSARTHTYKEDTATHFHSYIMFSILKKKIIAPNLCCKSTKEVNKRVLLSSIFSIQKTALGHI